MQPALSAYASWTVIALSFTMVVSVFESGMVYRHDRRRQASRRAASFVYRPVSIPPSPLPTERVNLTIPDEPPVSASASENISVDPSSPVSPAPADGLPPQ